MTYPWTGDEMATSSHQWKRALASDEVAVLESFAEATGELTLASPEDFETFPVLSGADDLIRDIRHHLVQGVGFVLVQGFPGERFSMAAFERVYWGIGCRLGVPVTQNANRELIGHVYDEGKDGSSLNYRGFATRLGSPFHVDLSDAAGLMCVREAYQGGNTQLVSSQAIYQTLMAERSDLMPVLERGFYWDRRGEEGDGESPGTDQRIPVFERCGEIINCRMHRGFINWWVKRSGEALSRDEAEALDLVEAIANRPGMMLETRMAPGDILFVNNYAVLHARTAFEDWPQKARGRHLLRLWLEVDGISQFADARLMRFGVIHHGDLGLSAKELLAGKRIGGST